MIGDNELPASWQGSYGTLNTRQALAEIHARLLRLETPEAEPLVIGVDEQENTTPRSAVLFHRCADGHFECKHVTVIRQRVFGYFVALAALQGGRNWVFVRPDVASALLDFLEADGNQTTGSPAGV